jgi:RNA polymerase sigma factor (sigma-70 family)
MPDRGTVVMTHRGEDRGLECIERLYRQYAAELSVALALSVGDRWEAEDLAHEVFLLALPRATELMAHPDPRGWLFRTGYNLARNRLRRLARLRRHTVAVENPVIADGWWADSVDLRESLRKLSPRQRDATVLHHYLGLSLDETAAALGCEPASVKTHLRRARARLGEMLRPTEGVSTR